MHDTDFAEKQSMSTSGISFCMPKGKILACKTKCCNFFKVHPLLWLHYITAEIFDKQIGRFKKGLHILSLDDLNKDLTQMALEP